MYIYIYIYRRDKTVFACTGCSTSHSQNHQKSPQCFWKRRKFVTKCVTLCVLDQSIIRNRTST